jgi:hypothetical protein
MDLENTLAMMKPIGAYQLGEEGQAFFRREIKKAGPLVSELNIGWGNLWAYLPSAAAPVTFSNLEEGGVFSPEDAYEIQQKVVTFVANFLSEDPSHILLCEDRFFSLADPPNINESQIFEYSKVTYHYKTFAESTKEIEDAISSASDYPTILLLTSGPQRCNLPERGSIGKELAADLSANVHHVIQGAFDEEGYIIWSKHHFAFISPS